MITKEKKAELIGKFRVHDTDNGSPEVQVAILTSRIEHLTKHMASNKKDFASLRGLMMLVGKRKRLLTYLQKKDVKRYRAVIGALELKK